MNKDEYLNHCYNELVAVFRLSKHNKKDDKLKYRTEGFIHAGKMLGLISHEDALATMEKAHVFVFGEKIQSRQKRKSALKAAIEKGDDTYIDVPAYERFDS